MLSTNFYWVGVFRRELTKFVIVQLYELVVPDPQLRQSK